MTGIKKENKERGISYRDIKALNYSMVKKFEENPIEFFQEFILGLTKDEKESVATTLGSLVDFILLDCGRDERVFEQKMEEKFVLFDGVRTTAQAFDLADEVYKIIINNTDEEGTATISFEDAFREGFILIQEKGKYKGKTWEKGLEDFNKVAGEYFKTKMDSVGKTVIDLWMIDKAKKMVEQAKGDEFHGELVNMTSGDGIEVIDKLAIEFGYMDWECKMEQDRTIIDHNSKIIRRIDYKTSFDNENFEYSYLKRKYYLQNSFYHIGTCKWAESNGLGDYEIGPMEFLVLDTSVNGRRPLKYNTSLDMVAEGLGGFSYRGRNYRGINQLLEEIKWCKDEGIWTMSRENHLNKGVVDMKTYNETDGEL